MLSTGTRTPAIPTGHVQGQLAIPGSPEMRAAWHRLPVETRDWIGTLAVEHAFAMFLTGDLLAPEDQVLRSDPVAQVEAGHRADDTLEDMMSLIEGTLPELFGIQGELPAWAATVAADKTA